MEKTSQTDRIATFDKDLERTDLQGFWRSGRSGVTGYPVTSVKPHLWKWADMYPHILRAGEVIELKGYDRRTVRLVNPSLEGWAYTTKTMHVSMQHIAPGEVAAAHRHTMAAIRFVIEGNGAYTTVEGQQCLMEEGDLILTPNLTWHDHTNNSPAPIIFLNGVDMPLVQYLDQWVQDLYPTECQDIQFSSESVNRVSGQIQNPNLSGAELIHYKWRETYPALIALKNMPASLNVFDGIVLEYRNPVTGKSTLPTMQCAVQLLPAGYESKVHRHTSTAIYYVFKGSGKSLVGQDWIEWEKGDVFVVPLWFAHQHINASASDDAILFSMTDEPLIKALELYRVQVADQ